MRMGEVVSDGRGGESRDGSPNESSTKAAMEASVPGHVREVGAEVRDASWCWPWTAKLSRKIEVFPSIAVPVITTNFGNNLYVS